MTAKKPIGLLFGALVSVAVLILPPANALASGDVPPPAGPGKGAIGPERPVPAPEKILPAAPPGGGWCPAFLSGPSL